MRNLIVAVGCLATVVRSYSSEVVALLSAIDLGPGPVGRACFALGSFTTLLIDFGLSGKRFTALQFLGFLFKQYP